MWFTLGIIVFGARLRPIVRHAIGIAGPPCFLVILIGRLDNGVQPLTDRHAGSTGGLARCRARLRTETS
jgi:hypothetical protein